MKNILLKSRVERLRKQGKTYSEIQKILGVKIPKSTLSDWCKGLSLPLSYRAKIKKLNTAHLKKVRKKALKKNKEIGRASCRERV